MSLTGNSFVFIANQRCIDFINTEVVDQGQRVDLLANFGDLLEWMVRANLMGRAQAARVDRWSNARKAGALKAAKEFRSLIRDLVDHLARGKSVPEPVLSEINRRLRRVSGHPQIFRSGRSFSKMLESEFRQPAHLLAALAESAADLLCNHDVALVKKCKNPACILYFYDTSKNHSRNWCSMEICGNRMKVASYYRRSRSARLQMPERA
jgi:predicted RNA-binding Zn ribbon-like protein